MIHSIGVLGTVKPLTQKSVQRRSGEGDFKQILDTVSITSDEVDEGRYGITPEQKKVLRDKYKNTELVIGSDDTRKFLEEMKNLGVITEQEIQYGEYLPVWRDRSTEIDSIVPETSMLENADIRNTFHSFAILQRGEAKEVSGKAAEMFINASEAYEKLANIMDYIFN